MASAASSSSSAGAPPPSKETTPQMRERAALGMDPYDYEPEGAGGYGWYGDASSDGARAGQRRGKGELGDGGVGKVDLRSVAAENEPLILAERRAHAAHVLSTPELLMMHAVAAGDSIPATRLRWMRILCGYDRPQAPSGGDEEDADAENDRLAKTPSRKAYGARRRAGDETAAGR